MKRLIGLLVLLPSLSLAGDGVWKNWILEVTNGETNEVHTYRYVVPKSYPISLKGTAIEKRVQCKAEISPAKMSPDGLTQDVALSCWMTDLVWSTVGFCLATSCHSAFLNVLGKDGGVMLSLKAE